MVIAINNSWQLCPWAEALYGADPTWWRSDRTPGPGFAGRRMTQDTNWRPGEAEALGLEVWPSVEAPGLSLAPPTIRRGGDEGGGGNSAFQAANIAVHEGAARVLLTGVDLTGTHWHGTHGEGLHNPEPGQMARWGRGWALALPDFAAAGVELLNCTRGGALEEVPRRPLEEALNP